MRSYKYGSLVVVCLLGLVWGGCASVKPAPERIAGRTYPSIFQAWNPIEMNDAPLSANQERQRAAARHDLLWEEPVSQFGYGLDRVLGATWDHEHEGLATQFTPASRKRALASRKAMLKMNPNMLFLVEIRWKDAPGSFLPEDSDGWLQNADGTRRPGETSGSKPYYDLNYQAADLRTRIAKQAHIAVASGVYDGILLDGWGASGENDPNALDLLSRIRAAIGPEAIVVVNNDRLSPLPNSAPYINGAFLEMPLDWRSEDAPQRWQEIREQLKWFETNLQKPAVNCLEIQGGADSDMRAGLALALIYTNGYYLFSRRDNSDPTSGHRHEWSDLYDVGLGRPTGPPVSPTEERPEGAGYREYEGGAVVFNPLVNEPITIELDADYRRASTGEIGREFSLAKGDGDIFLLVAPAVAEKK